jgi:nucleoid-associated protein YgaU
MGRETKILLTLLGLLAGIFVGVVALKLFVPRPPAGTGPDIHAALAASEPVPLVEPPALETRTGPRADDYAGRSSRFGGSPLPAAESRDLLVTPVSYEPPAEAVIEAPAAAEPPTAFVEQAADLLPPPTLPPPRFEAPPPEPPAAAALPVRDPAFTTPTFQAAPQPRPAAPPAFAGSRPVPGGGYLTHEGDSWWSLAEQAYGDGRLYRALFAWNRTLDPRVSLVPGTHLEIPPPAQLGAAWPALLPTD